jgi:uncharacterized membrane protein YkoI
MERSMFRSFVTACTVVILASLGSLIQANAGQPPEGAGSNDAITAANAKVPLREAIAAAEQQLQGKAVRADFETERGSPGEYEIEVVAGAKVFLVRVDADKGTVIATKEDKTDGDRDDKDVD